MRLIDADAFLERIQNDTSLCAEIKLYGLKILKRYLDLQPTAYDIDKVVKELYEKRTEILLSNDYECEIINYCIDNFDNAIEIVKQSGDADDNCKWSQISTARYETSCGYKLVEFFDTNACYIFEHYIKEIAEELKAGGKE